MRRFLAGLLVGCFLALVGVQAAHRHDAAKSADRCSVCALAQQATRQAPKAAPAIVRRHSSSSVVLISFHAPASRVAAERRARAPPELA